MSQTEISRLENLLGELNTLYLETDDPNEMSELEDQINQTKQKLTTLADEKSSKCEDFVNRVCKLRTQNTKSTNELFQIAKADAEKTVEKLLCMPPEEIARVFSTKNRIINPISGSKVCPERKEYRWYHDLHRREHNEIPLSTGITNPTIMDKTTRQPRVVQFLVSKFYSDRQFIDKCKKYYEKHGLKLDVTKDPANKRWYIALSLIHKNLVF
jgi:hypothetical protein